MAVEGVPKFVVDESADTDRRGQESDETKARLELAGGVPVGTVASGANGRSAQPNPHVMNAPRRLQSLVRAILYLYCAR